MNAGLPERDTDPTGIGGPDGPHGPHGPDGLHGPEENGSQPRPPVSHLDAAVVVPSYGRPKRLAACLDALAAQDLPASAFEVIVVDDGSPQPLAAVVECPRGALRARSVRQVNAGPAAARNAGAALAAAPLVVFTDDDCRPEPGWLSALVAAHAAAPGALLGGPVVNALPHDPWATAAQVLVDHLHRWFAAGTGRAFRTSNNLALSRARFAELDGFDTTFPLPAGEDRDLCERWNERGWPVAVVEAARVAHAHTSSPRGFWRQQAAYGRGAHAFHERRAARGAGGNRPEPPAFYAALLAAPWRSGLRGTAAVRTLALLVLAQVANVWGYLAESRRRARTDG